MPFDSLREFMVHLETRGALVRVKEPVSPVLEITEIHTRLLADRGPAVLFENVEGFAMPVLTNLFGTVERVAWGMDREPHQLQELGETLAFFKQPVPPESFGQALELLPLVKVALSMKPKFVSRAPCQEIVLKGADIDLGQLPIQTCWPGEPAPLITWPLVVTKGPSDAREDKFNLGIYRMQVLGKDRTLMRWLKHRGGAQHHRRWGQSRKDPLPCAAVLGADPGVTLAAVTPVPDTMSEYQFAGLLRGRRVELVDCVSVPIKVPATAEIVLEGHVSLEEFGDEGPYGDHTGYYNAVEPFPVFTVSAITMRRDPIYLSTFTGRPPDEPSVLGEALNDVFVPLAAPAVPRDQGLLAAARGLQLPGGRGLDPEGLSRPCPPDHDGRLVVPAPVHVHQVRHRRGRRHRLPQMGRRHLGDQHPGRPRPRPDGRRAHPHRLSRLRLARIRPRRQARHRRHGQVAARDQARMGQEAQDGRGGGGEGDGKVGATTACRDPGRPIWK